MVMTAPKTNAIFTKLNRRNSVVGVRCGMKSKRNGCSQIAEASPGQSFERGDFGSHLVKQSFDCGEAILAGDIENELVQEFPFRPGVALRFDGFDEPLYASFDIGEGAALFGVGCSGQDVMRQSRGFVRQNLG